VDLLADTSVAVPAVLTSHSAHDEVDRALGDLRVALAAHGALETYSVLTRLPGDARLHPADASRLLSARFGSPVSLPPDLVPGLVARFAERGIAGGAVYDALIAETAHAFGLRLLTRDTRAAATYARLGVAHEYVG
jgi:predicted nucleic acid-binding protein